MVVRCWRWGSSGSGAAETTETTAKSSRRQRASAIVDASDLHRVNSKFEVAIEVRQLCTSDHTRIDISPSHSQKVNKKSPPTPSKLDDTQTFLRPPRTLRNSVCRFKRAIRTSIEEMTCAGGHGCRGELNFCWTCACTCIVEMWMLPQCCPDIDTFSGAVSHILRRTVHEISSCQ